jgi:hypothetical protein
LALLACDCSLLLRLCGSTTLLTGQGRFVGIFLFGRLFLGVFFLFFGGACVGVLIVDLVSVGVEGSKVAGEMLAT